MAELDAGYLPGKGLATSATCPKCGFANQPEWTYCMNCGRGLQASTTSSTGQLPAMPPSPQNLAQISDLTYSNPPHVYGPIPPAPEQPKQIERTKRGVILLLLGALVAWIPTLIVGLFGGLLTLIGAVLVIVGRKAFGAAHRRNVVVSIILFFFGYLMVFVGGIAAGVGAATALSSSTTEAELATALQNIMMNMLVVVAMGSILGGLSSVFFTYALQKTEGHFVLWAAYAATVGIQIAILAVTIPDIPFIAAVIANEVATGHAVDPSEIAIVVSAKIVRFWPLYAIPSLLIAGANYLAWNRIGQGEVPTPITSSGSQSTRPPAPPINPL